MKQNYSTNKIPLKIHSSGLDIFVNENKFYKAQKDYAGYLSLFFALF